MDVHFHVLYHRTGAAVQFGNLSWLGAPIQICPFDTWVMQKLLWELRPDVIVETGTYLAGSSTSSEIVARIRQSIKSGEKVIVFLDSDHRAPHVAEEIRLYAPLVTPGSYLIVEDTQFNGHPVLPKFGPGPREAVDGFLGSNRDLEPDRSREKFGMTFNPRGYLKRVR
ncbi:MAG: CmcI family methyltransferase [Bryobacteraceae bacterium]